MHDAGWGVNRGNKLCRIRVRHGDNHIGYNNCRLEAPYWHRGCHQIFGPYYDFPQKTEANKGVSAIFDCHKISNGLLPATHNIRGANQCTCAQGSIGSGKSCVCPAGMSVWNGKCAVCPVGAKPSGNGCACLIPGQEIIRGVCTCPPDQVVVDGACACPPASDGAVQGMRQPPSIPYGVCGVCPEGEGVLNNGACGVCPGGASFLVNGICASPDNSYEQPAPIALGKPVVREMLAYDTANFPGNALILRWGAPLHSDGGEILEYRVRRQRSVSGAVSKTGSNSWPALCDTLAANQWNRPTGYTNFGPDVFEHTYDTIDAHLAGLANYSCYRFYVSARNAAGWGPEAVTDPIMVRPARGGSAVSCRADQARAWNTGVDYAANHGCLSRDVVQGVDACHRIGGGYVTQFRPRYGRSDQNRDGHLCHREDENVTCGPYRREQVVDYQLLGVVWDRDVLCHIGEGPHCPSGEFYDFAHRACMCNGMGARPAPGGVCVCSVEGADNNCNCPSGTVYHPDINKCAYGKWGEEFALTSPLSGAVEPDEVGEVRLRVYRTATGEPFPEGGVFNVYLGDSKTPLADSCRNAALEFKTVTLTNPARRVAGVEGTCSPNLPVGTHNLRAEYQLRAGHMLVGGGRRNCDATCQARTRLRAFALPSAAVTVEQERQKNCENPNPAINPAGGEWRSEAMQCLLRTEAFFRKTGDFVCGHNDAAGLPECDDVFAEMRKVDCLAEGLVYKQEGGAGVTPDYSCVCPHLGEVRGVNGSVCSSESDTKLINEVQSPSATKASVLALLEEGASPNLVDIDRNPLLVVALTMGHAEIVSVLITAGAEASVQINGDFLPEHLAKNGLELNDRTPNFTWIRVLTLMTHFGDAVRVVDLTSRAPTAYDWATARGNFHVMAHLRSRYDNHNPSTAEQEEIKAIGGYMLDQGTACPANIVNHVVCASRRACNSARSGLTYSCTECPGFPLRSASGRVCVAECANSSQGADTTTWPDSQCQCADGTSRDELGCVSDHDPTLIAEVKKTKPNLATVRYLLDQGARAGITSAGVPLLIVAATLRHAEVVSVLITAGADPNAEHTDGGTARTVPAYAVISVAGYSAREDAELLIHFGGGVSVNSNVEFDYWDNEELQALYFNPLSARHGLNSDASEKDALEVMAAYLGDQIKDGPSNCEQFSPHTNDEQALCIKSRRKCGTTARALTYYSCELCENGNNIRGVHNNICVAACGANEVFNADAWPDPACECADGHALSAQGQCAGEFDAALFTAVNTAKPVLSYVVNLLKRGANPNFINSDGIHVLVAAATLLHAEVVSVLITAGANSRLETAVAGRGSAVRVFPEIIVHEFGRSNNSTLAIRTAEALRHFGDAAALVSPAAAYPWDAEFNYVPIHKNLYTLLAGRVTMALDEETRAAAKFMAEYLNDRGVSCARHLSRGHPLCVPSRVCPTTGDSVYSCSECAGHSLRARTAAACVAECGGANEEANTAAWPDGQCQCAEGAADELGCPSDHDRELIEEVEEKSRPNLDNVRRLLGFGARPDVANSAGVPLVFVAATLGHAEVVSVLVTAGANARARITLGYAEVAGDFVTVQIGDLLPEYLAKNGLSGDPATATITLPWRDVADVMIHFGAAVDIVALTSGGVAYNWATDRGTLHALEHLRRSYDDHNRTSADKTVMEVIGGYMLDQGAACPDDIVDHAICASRRACAAPGSGMAYSCSACAGFPLRSQDGASCVAECGRSEETGDAAWPDRQCQCMDGDEPDEFGCPSPHDGKLIEEIGKARPDLAAVRDWLNRGARPGVTTSAGIPPLVVAATLLHAEIVSVLITAGADVSVKFWIEADDENQNRSPQLLPVLLAQLAASFEHTLSANRKFAETFFHFGDAAGDRFNWQYVPPNFVETNVGDAVLYYMDRRHGKNLASADSAPADLAQNPFLERVGWYVQDRGGACGNNVADKDSPVCVRPTCPATSAGIYTCSQCPGFPLYSESRGACVAQCEDDEETDTTTWPDGQCKCLNGPPDEFGCRSTHDSALITAVQASPQNLARVRELLDLGARPDITTSAGTPILVVAATLGRAEIVSVLITAGANASVSVGMNYIPEHLAENGITNETATTTLLPWRDVADVMIHFGGAVNVAALTSGVVVYDWSETGRYDILTHLNFSYDTDASRYAPTEEEKAVMEVIGGYALDQGAACPNTLRNEPLCASRRICPAADSGKAYSCSAACPGLPALSFNGVACAAQCRGNEELDATTWPDEQCACPAGTARDEFGCRSSRDLKLIAEVQKTPQNLVSVRALLDQGARPGITTSAGIPILIVAATLRHADIVSVLITAGADPNAEHQSARVPTHAAIGADGHSARDDAELLIHFGNAAAIAAITSTFVFSWRGSDIASLVARYEDAATTDEEKYALEVMGAYLVDQGADCAAHAGSSAAALCQDSRRGCIPSKFPQYYSCGLCQNGNNVLGVSDNNICVAACGANEDLDATAWPDPVCKCASGQPPNAQGQCPGPGTLDDDLFAEVNAANPALSSVVALLNDGANPNFINSDAIHVLVAAATLLRADVISVLVTAGATPQARAPDTRLIPDLIVEGLSDVSNADQARRMAEAMLHFGDAVAQATLTSSAFASAYFWSSEAEFNQNLYAKLRRAHDGAANGEIRTVIKFMAEYLRDQGALCELFLAPDSALCAYSRACPATGGVSSCSYCSGHPLRSMDGASCVSACGGNEEADATAWPDGQCQCVNGTQQVGGICVLDAVAAKARLCLQAGWPVSSDGGGACGTPVTLFGGSDSSRCSLTGFDSPQCAAVFGAGADRFPAPVTSPAGATLSFVYGCDPDESKKLVPAVVNTIGATECACPPLHVAQDGACAACPAGHVAKDGACVECPVGQGVFPDGTCGDCPAGSTVEDGVCAASAERLCASKNWDYDMSDESCGIKVTLAGVPDAGSVKCYLSGSGSPQCAAVFGSNADIPFKDGNQSEGVDDALVYNCDPNTTTGLIPATANRILATECACPFGQTVQDGVCACPGGDEDVVRDGTCVPKKGDLSSLSNDLLCRVFGGTELLVAGGKICHGMDANDTFCIMDSDEGFPCRGLFQHLQKCNLQFERPALNPFFCGEKCGENKRAIGYKCCPGDLGCP